MADTDQHLVAQVRAGNHSAFRVLIERWSPSLYRLAFRMTGNTSDAEDIVQETFLRAWRQFERFEDRSAFSTWIYRIASNCAIDTLRSRARTSNGHIPERVATNPPPDRLALSAEFRDRLREALDELSDQERLAFLLRHYEGLSISGISAALGVSDSAAKNTIFRAVHKLRRQLQPLCT